MLKEEINALRDSALRKMFYEILYACLCSTQNGAQYILHLCLFRLQSVRDSEEENRLQSVEEMRNEIAVLKGNVEVTECQITYYIFIRPNFFQAKLTGLPLMFLFSVVERFGGRKPVAQRRNKYTKRICGNEFSLFKKLSTQIENLSFSSFSPTRCSDLRGRSKVATIDLINSNWFDFCATKPLCQMLPSVFLLSS